MMRKMQSEGTASNKLQPGPTCFTCSMTSSSFSTPCSASTSCPYCFKYLRSRSASISSDSPGFLMIASMMEIGFFISLATQTTRFVLRQSNQQNSCRMRMLSRLILRQLLERDFTQRVMGSKTSLFISNSFIKRHITIQIWGNREARNNLVCLKGVPASSHSECILTEFDCNIQRLRMGLREGVLLLLLLVAAQGQACTLENCDECDMQSLDSVTNLPTECLTCHGWYESSWETYLCVLSARLIILCVVSGLLFIAIVVCSVFKVQEYRAKYTERPTNIESLDLDTPQASEEELRTLTWQHSSVRINDTSRCNICEVNGGSVRLGCGHVFHGDCICWELRKNNKCPACNSTDTQECTVHCIKCLSSFIKCRPELYVDIKKHKSRVCDECSRKE